MKGKDHKLYHPLGEIKFEDYALVELSFYLLPRPVATYVEITLEGRC